MSNALMKIEEYKITTTENLQELIQANLGGGKLNPWDLDTIKFPSQKITNWDIPDITQESGFRTEKELTGVIIMYHDVRRYWAGKFGESENSAPDCTASNGMEGVGTPGGNCDTCEFGNWQRDDSGKESPPECKLSRDMMMLLPNQILPVNISIGPGSYTNVKKYFTKLLSAGVRYWDAVSSITLTTAQANNKGKTEYPKASIRMVELVENPDIKQVIESYRNLI